MKIQWSCSVRTLEKISHQLHSLNVLSSFLPLLVHMLGDYLLKGQSDKNLLKYKIQTWFEQYTIM